METFAVCKRLMVIKPFTLIDQPLEPALVITFLARLFVMDALLILPWVQAIQCMK